MGELSNKRLGIWGGAWRQKAQETARQRRKPTSRGWRGEGAAETNQRDGFRKEAEVSWQEATEGAGEMQAYQWSLG